MSMSAVADLLAGMPQLHLAFVGRANPETADAMRATVTEAGIVDRLHFVDPVPLDEVVGFVGDADLCLLLRDGGVSRDNAFAMPNKLFDCLAAGLAVLAPKGSLAAEFVVREGLGRAYSLDASGDLPATTRALLGDGETRHGLGSAMLTSSGPRSSPS